MLRRLVLCLSLLVVTGCAGASLGRMSLPSLPAVQGADAVPIRLVVQDGLPPGHAIFEGAGFRGGARTAPRSPRAEFNPAGLMETVGTAFRDAFLARGFPLTDTGRPLTVSLVDAQHCTAIWFGGISVMPGPGAPIAVPNNRTVSVAVAAFVATVRTDDGTEVFSRRYVVGDTFSSIGPLPRDHFERALRTAVVSITGDAALIAALRDGIGGDGARRHAEWRSGTTDNPCHA